MTPKGEVAARSARRPTRRFLSPAQVEVFAASLEGGLQDLSGS
jgi:hypothetical protein